MKKIVNILLIILKILFYIAIFEIIAFYLDIRFFNRYCDLVDTIGYSHFTNCIRFVSKHFVLIYHLVLTPLLIINFQKPHHQGAKHRA